MKVIDRKEFLSILGSAAVATTAVGCANKNTQKGSANGSTAAGELTYRQFEGRDKVSILGYGCMRWPLKKGTPKGENPVDMEQTQKLVDQAIEAGVNYFDTAPVYIQGWSEKVMGETLKKHPRDSYYIATKLSNFSDSSAENSRLLYKKSFENLQTDYIDYYLLHSAGGGNGLELFNKRFVDNGMLDFLLKEREAGRIRNLGWSFHGSVEVFDQVLAMHDTVKWDFVQIQLNYQDWHHASGRNVNAEYLYNELEKRNIPVVIMEPLLGGRLSKVPNHIATRLMEREPEKSVASWAFRFAASHDKVLTVLSGMTYKEHLEDNLDSYTPLVPLTEEEKEFLYETAELMSRYPTIPCNDCKYCMPCPYGIDIPAVLLHYNKCVNEGDIAKSSMDENYKSARRAFLVGYDRSVSKLRQASHCIGCDQCSHHCPQKINIPKELHKIDKYVEALKQGTL